jgi:hypothetical protein
MDLYINRRKIQEKSMEMLRLLVISKMFRNFHKNFKRFKEKKTIRMHGRFMAVILANAWRRKLG